MAQDLSTEATINELDDNRYMIVNVAAYRARQINGGTEVYVRTRSRHPLKIALEEIAEGKITYCQNEEIAEPERVDIDTDDLYSFDELFDESEMDPDDVLDADDLDVAFEEEEITYEEPEGGIEDPLPLEEAEALDIPINEDYDG